VQVALIQGRWEEALSTDEELLAVLAIHDHENILPEATAWRIRALAELGRTDEAVHTLEELPDPTGLWPHVQVRTDLALGRALAALGQRDEAREALLRALSVSEANGYRFFQLLAHLDLRGVQPQASDRDRHLRVARGLARSLASNLPRDDARRFLSHHLGEAADGP
jgi:tetratricopeptide (TPR) repeat protein